MLTLPSTIGYFFTVKENWLAEVALERTSFVKEVKVSHKQVQEWL